MNDDAHPRFGAIPLDADRTAFRLWAPAQRKVELQTAAGQRFDMAAEPGGWFAAVLPLPVGTEYRYLVEHDGATLAIPDPASRAQADDVHGASRVVDPSAYVWRCPDWHGRPWHEAVIYELHVGLLGGFAGVAAKLPELAELGFTAIELMPVADFPGPRNWGYDGVLPYAPDASYGTPDDLRRLVDRAHELGLMVFLDVVYNHFGPDGNYLGLVAPQFFRDDLKTPWGAAIDFRRPEVRAFFTDNAIEWVRDFRIDGLRLDAVHAISEVDWLDEMALAVRAAAGPDRLVHLVVENEHNDAERLTPDPYRFDAQWNDDAHHALHVLLTGNTEAYYIDYADAPAERLARVLAEGFDYQGQASAFRHGGPRGTPSAALPCTAFVDALQNHDQIGNRAFGDRLSTLADPAAVRAATALLLLSPHVPLVFMGEEVGSRTPFLYFTSHAEELAQLVRDGRRAEFAGFAAFADPAAREAIPDPNDPATFERSRPEPGPDAEVWRALFRELLQLRRTRLAPFFAGARSAGAVAIGPKAVSASWKLGEGSTLVVACNLGDEPAVWRQAPHDAGRLYAFGTLERGHLGAHSTIAFLVPAVSDELRRLAEAAGIAVEWEDFEQRRHTLGAVTIGRLLDALGHPNGDAQATAASLAQIEATAAIPPLLTARVGEPLELRLPSHAIAPTSEARLTLESGATRGLGTQLEPEAAAGAPLRLRLDAIDEPGYHRVELTLGGHACALTVAIAPKRAWDEPLTAGRCWGTTVQLYALRPETARADQDIGLGDYGALARFATALAARGAAALAVSPTHAGFAADSSRFSPYSPSSRLAYNVLYVDPTQPFGVEAAAAAARTAGIAAEARKLAAEPLIDWPAAGPLKMRWLQALFDAHAAEIAAADPADPTDPADRSLRQHAKFEALHAHFFAQGLADWQSWPAPFQDPNSAEVAAFVAEHAHELRFHGWLQRCAAEQLQAAQAAARAAGMRIGLISDLAIGMSPAGSHAWAVRSELMAGVEVGAPPDAFNPAGQSWGLAAFSPRALQQRGFAPFLATLRAAMAHAGGVRIDHVLGLRRLWLVPEGAAASQGGYVAYPIRDLVNLVILESHRHQAIVIGEDLGTVPAGFREMLEDAGILGMRVLWFQRDADDAGFLPPERWTAAAVAMTTTHDLPTGNGWWQGRDIEWREAAGSERNAETARAERTAQKAQLAALASVGSNADAAHGADADAGAGAGADAKGEPDERGLKTRSGADLAIDIVGRTPSALVLVPVEDLLGLVEQPNIPGTTDEHPNWRRRLAWPADRLLDDPATRARIERLERLRGA